MSKGVLQKKRYLKCRNQTKGKREIKEESEKRGEGEWRTQESSRRI